jgi:4-hydroxybenzoate polyprenyltransferase
MIKLISLYLLMIRYRVAVMLLMFFLLGLAVQHQLTQFQISYILASLALISSYAGATTLNDIADRDIDKINHPKNKGRPLITGYATEADLYKTHVLAGSIALLAAISIDGISVLLVVVSLIINYIYSMRPIRLSYRTHFAHALLAIAYVLLPFLFGIHLSGKPVTAPTVLFGCALLALFYGRIFLKDFRDRKGDAMYRKPTFLLEYGKTATCFISFGAVITGNLLLFFSLPANPLILLLLEVFFFAIYSVGVRLYQAHSAEQEQIAIGIGAKAGNQLLLSLLGLLIIQEYQAPTAVQILFLLTMVIFFLIHFWFLFYKPGFATLGYRG